MLSKEIPFLRIIVPLCLGIISYMLWAPGPYFGIFLNFLTITGLLLSLLYNYRLLNHVFGIAIFVAFFSFGLTLCNIEKASISSLKPDPAIFVSTLSDFPVEKENTFLLTVKLNRIISNGINRRVRGSILLYFRKDSVIGKMLPGDILVVKCTPLEVANRGNPQEFDYKSFMASKGIRYYAFTGKQNLLARIIPRHRKIVHIALIIREKIIKMYKERGVTTERLPLVSAITLGQKNLLDPETRQIFIKAGIMHIMAVSGLHAVILSLFIFKVLFFLKGKFNIIRILITLLILWAFAFVTGLTPSVLRATLMFTFLQAGTLLKRKVNGINSVLASAFFLIILQPSIITDAGFLLSYAAVIYIIGFYQDLYLKLEFSGWLPDKIWQSVVVTLVAQAGTLPLTIMLFNRFPVYFILTNIIIVPLANLLIIIGCLVPLTYSIVPLSEFLAFILDKLTGLIEFLTGSAASLPYSTIDRIGITTTECIFLTVTISLLMTFILKNKPFSFKYPVVASICLVLVMNIKKIENGKTSELIVYNNPKSPAIGIRTGNTLQLLTNNDSIPGEALRHAASRGLRIKIVKNDDKPMYLKTSDCKILITDSLRNISLRDKGLDILVLTGRKPYIEKNIPNQSLPPAIIISSEAASGFRLPFSSRLLTNKTIRYVRKSGAYVSRL